MLLAGNFLSAQEKFELLQAGSHSYSNVTVNSKTASHLFIRHAQGFATIKVKELGSAVQQQLGYVIEPPRATRPKTNLIGQIQLDPRLRQMEEALVQGIEGKIQELDRNFIISILAGLFLVYLCFCYCCLLICKKAGYEPGLWIWLPIVQIFPLLKAASMSGWNFILFWLPITNLVVSIVWCVKICKARTKSPWLALFLLVPVTNVLAFLYLAFSDAEVADEQPVAKLQFS